MPHLAEKSRGESRLHSHTGKAVKTWTFWPVLALLIACLSHLSAQDLTRETRGFVYIEPNVLRFECLIPVSEAFALLEETPTAELDPALQIKLKEKAQRLAAGWLQIRLDDLTVTTPALNVSIVKGEPGKTEILLKDQSVAANTAMVGFSWEEVYDKIPQNVTFEWKGLSAIPSLNVTVIMGEQGEDFVFSSATSQYDWENKGRVLRGEPLMAVPVAPAVERVGPSPRATLWILAGFLFLILQVRKSRSISGRAASIACIVVVAAVIIWQFAADYLPAGGKVQTKVSAVEAEKILFPLLRNTYRAFDQRKESALYDVLARSIHGELLQKLYLQFNEALSLDGNDGTRIKVTDLDVQVENVEANPNGPGFIATSQWTALGSVGHWGHSHQRINRYTAKITVEPVQKAWKITHLEVKEERRL